MCLTIPLIDIKPYVPGFDTKAVTSTGWLEKTQEKAQNMKSDTRFVVLLGPLGPVIIDLPQAVDATANNHAEKMMERDVDNMTAYYARFAPQLKESQYAKEIWALYDSGELNPEQELTGLFEDTTRQPMWRQCWKRSKKPWPKSRNASAGWLHFINDPR